MNARSPVDIFTQLNGFVVSGVLPGTVGYMNVGWAILVGGRENLTPDVGVAGVHVYGERPVMEMHEVRQHPLSLTCTLLILTVLVPNQFCYKGSCIRINAPIPSTRFDRSTGGLGAACGLISTPRSQITCQISSNR